jgi:hypothetical protein
MSTDPQLTAAPKAWAMGGTLYASIHQRSIVLFGHKDPITKITQYSGTLDFQQDPLSLKTLVDQFLDRFDLKLPSTVPDLTFYELRGAAVISPDEKKSYRFQAYSRLDIPNPFSLQNNSISFKQLDLSLTRVVSPPVAPPAGGNGASNTPKPATQWQTALSIAASVDYQAATPASGTPAPGDTLHLGDARLDFANGDYAIGLNITAEINPSKILDNVLGVTIPPEISQFLPIFKPQSTNQPIRLYQASSSFDYIDIAEDGTATPIPYTEGFILDQLVIEVLKLNFLVSLSITNGGFTISASTPVVSFLPGNELFQLLGAQGLGNQQVDPQFGPKFSLISDRSGKSIQLLGFIEFFPNASSPLQLKYEFDYSFATKEFTGDSQYIGTIAGQKDPEIGFAWSKANGFRITKFPFDQGALSDAIDWASQFKRLANASTGSCESACKKIINFAFNEVITTKFDFKYKTKPGAPKGQFMFDVSGTFNVSAANNTISEIDFDPITIIIDIPTGLSDLAKNILNSLKDSIGSIAEGLWNNQAQMLKLFGMITIKEGGEAALCRLSCKVGEKALKEFVDDLAADAASAATSTIAEAAAAVVIAVSAISTLLSILTCGSSGDSKENREKRKKAQERKEQAQKEIQAKLTIPSISAVYDQAAGNAKNIQVSWGDVPAEHNPATGTIYYVVTITSPAGVSPVRVARNPNHPQSTYSCTITKPELKFGATYSICVQAHYDYGSDHYAGSSKLVSVQTPILQTPQPSVSLDWTTYQEKKQGILSSSWPAVVALPAASAGGISNTAFDIQLKNVTTGTVLDTKTNTATDPSTPPIASYQYQFYPDTGAAFIPNPDHQFQIIVTALASDPDLNSPAGTSSLFKIPTGVGYMRIDYNFKLGDSAGKSTP